MAESKLKSIIDSVGNTVKTIGCGGDLVAKAAKGASNVNSSKLLNFISLNMNGKALKSVMTKPGQLYEKAIDAAKPAVEKTMKAVDPVYKGIGQGFNMLLKSRIMGQRTH